MYLFANSDLRERIMFLAGSQSQYVLWLQEHEGIELSRSWLSRVLNGHVATPWKLAVTLVRLAEGDATLSKDEAWARRDKWFDVRKENDRD